MFGIRFLKLLKVLLIIYLNNNLLFVNAAHKSNWKRFSGELLRVASVNYPPIMVITKNPDGAATYSGTAIPIVETFAQLLDLKIQYVPLKMSDLIKYGPEMAQIMQIVKNETDLATIGITLHIKHYQQNVELSLPIYMEPYRLIVPWPKEETRLLALIRPFQPWVWFSLGLAIAVLAPLLSALSGLYRRYVDIYNPLHRYNMSIIELRSLLFNFAFLLSHLTNQGYHYNLKIKSRGSKIIVGIWCLMTVVLANGYAGTLFSFMSVTKLEQPINSLEELASSKDVTLLTQSDTELTNRFLNASDGPIKLIGDSLRARPGNIFLTATSPSTIKLLMSGKHAFTFVDIFNSVVVDATYKQNNKKCKLTFSQKAIPYFSPMTYGFTKNGKYNEAFHEIVHLLTEAGIIYKCVNDFMPNVDQCRMENQKPDTRAKPLTLTDMTSCFIVLALGYGISIFFFLLELIYHKIAIYCFFVVRN